MISLESIVHWLHVLDLRFEENLNQYEFSRVLVHNVVSKYITEALFLIVASIICFETLYWSGIYLGLWEYHAKDIFREIPIHCAHVYVKVNLAKESDGDKVRELFITKKSNRFNVFEWKAPKESEKKLFLMSKSVKYNFEFSPEDFEENPEPEFGSSLEHLRKKVLTTLSSSNVYEKYLRGKVLDPSRVLVFNNNHEEVKTEDNKKYLSKIGIETGNLIECIVLV